MMKCAIISVFALGLSATANASSKLKCEDAAFDAFKIINGDEAIVSKMEMLNENLYQVSFTVGGDEAGAENVMLIDIDPDTCKATARAE